MAGVGTTIKKELASWGIKPKAGCSCIDLAREMDRVGIQAIENNLESYTDRMYDSIKEWRSTSRMPVPQPPKFIVKLLIEWAIQKNL